MKHCTETSAGQKEKKQQENEKCSMRSRGLRVCYFFCYASVIASVVMLRISIEIDWLLYVGITFAIVSVILACICEKVGLKKKEKFKDLAMSVIRKRFNISGVIDISRAENMIVYYDYQISICRRKEKDCSLSLGSSPPLLEE